MKTLVIQSYRNHHVPRWISRCLASLEAWARMRGYDYRLIGDEAFALCGEAYLAAVGDNKRSITNLCRLELIRNALHEGYDFAVWMDADILVFAPEALRLPEPARLCFARETWLAPHQNGWAVSHTLNNCVVVCPKGDPDLDFVISATRHRAARLPVTHNFEVGVELVRGLSRFMHFPLIGDIGMLSGHVVLALARGDDDVIGLQARSHGAPIHAANICASEHIEPGVPEAAAMSAMDALEQTQGQILNRHLLQTGAPAASTIP